MMPNTFLKMCDIFSRHDDCQTCPPLNMTWDNAWPIQWTPPLVTLTVLHQQIQEIWNCKKMVFNICRIPWMQESSYVLMTPEGYTMHLYRVRILLICLLFWNLCIYRALSMIIYCKQAYYRFIYSWLNWKIFRVLQFYFLSVDLCSYIYEGVVMTFILLLICYSFYRVTCIKDDNISNYSFLSKSIKNNSFKRN